MDIAPRGGHFGRLDNQAYAYEATVMGAKKAKNEGVIKERMK